MATSRTIQFELYTHCDPMFPTGSASAIDEIKFDTQGQELVLDCLLPSDAAAGNVIEATATHELQRDVSFSGSYELKEQDINTGTIELILKGHGEAGTYMTQLSLTGLTGGVKNVVDAQVELAHPILELDSSSKTTYKENSPIKTIVSKLKEWKSDLLMA
ncbi:hypothetical protein [Pseudoalteromonas luteoviolacea]|uniref:Uncharacterized protein n=1 Tax=Pseudoalteromonas luteoviolacea S4060-1 TaxID=1365257 RepID=A0A161YQP1_9GAMM|nr:hypothetical protein [Pseudoalteromonas luteoviolacea]KZN38442.1 hypothetical protein N480_12375 [Pseudoalteromonas luteoviolacea S2607]KZN64445.1 hypothetical protein N478_22375 [Pseudoalteromonas luteoviolacea S4060-1]